MKKQYYLKISLLLMAFATLMLVAACEEETQDDYNLNSAPYCTIIEPISGSVYREADTISITVAVDDPDNDVSKVYFYVNDSAIDSLTKAPYTTAWPTEGAQLGSHQIKARAVDEKNYYDIYYISITLIERIYFGNGDGVTDIDGNSYPTVIIGEQEWMAENLKTTTYNDGTPIELVEEDTAWENNSTGAYCWHDNDENQYAEIYGALYNGHAVNTGNLCPDGWHVPSDEEWKTLEMTLGMSQSEADEYGYYRGTNEGSKLAGNFELWPNDRLRNNSEFGESGFNALPGGSRSSEGQYTSTIYAKFWTRTNAVTDHIWGRSLIYYDPSSWRFFYGLWNGRSVRCVKD